MRVHFYQEDKKYFTMAEAPIVNTIIKDMKTSEETAASSVEYAMHALDERNFKVLKADAKISHNCRIYNYYNDESGTIDIWIDAMVVADYSGKFYMIGFYLSDAWSVGADNHDEIASRMYVRKFIES